ncbi:MAG: carbohydrate kinase family protein [Nocardioidaceae bacterium]
MTGTVLVVGDVVDDIAVRPLTATTHASDTDARIELRPGGSAANVAAWLGSTGVPTRFVGRVGADAVERHRSALALHGVEAHLVGDQDLRTATIVLLLDESAERTMFVDRGANAALRADDIPTGGWDDVAALHLTGYSLFDSGVRPAVLSLIETARRRRARVSVDPSSAAYLRAVGPAAFLRWVDGCDVLLPNLDEARVLVGGGDPAAMARELTRWAGTVVVTLGAAGVVAATADGDCVRRPASATTLCDTTGAGDAFAAGCLGATVTGAGLAESLDAGVRLAAEAVGVFGARPLRE